MFVVKVYCTSSRTSQGLVLTVFWRIGRAVSVLFACAYEALYERLKHYKPFVVGLQMSCSVATSKL